MDPRGDFATAAFVGRPWWTSYVPGVLTLGGERLVFTTESGRVRLDQAVATLRLGELQDRAARFDLIGSGGRRWRCRFWDRSAYPTRPPLCSLMGVGVTGFEMTDRWAAAEVAGEWHARLSTLTISG